MPTAESSLQTAPKFCFDFVETVRGASNDGLRWIAAPSGAYALALFALVVV